MAAPYIADASNVPSGALHHTLITLMPTALLGCNQQSFQSDIDGGVALFGEGVISILQNNEPFLSRTDIPTGTPSFVTHTLNRNAKGTNRDVSISGRDSDRDHQRSLQSDIDGVALFVKVYIRFYKTTSHCLEPTSPVVRSLQLDIDGLALFGGEGVNSILALSPRTDDVTTSGTESDIDQRWWQSDIDGVVLSAAAGVLPQDSILENDASATQTNMSPHTHATGTFYSGDCVADPDVLSDIRLM
eukprot:scaffold43259_cov66-Attheya_sp.AAC.5